MAVLGFFSVSVLAQGVIKGTVVDSKTNEPLIGAAVVIEGTTIGVSTNLDGTFELKADAGAKTVVFSFIGYNALTKEINLTDAGLDMGKVGLEADVIGLNEVMVMASVAIDRETPVAVSTITPLEIEEKLGTQEFPEMLKSTPGVYATKAGGGYGDSRINLRGFSSANVGVLINGVPVNGMENGKVYWSNWSGLSDVTRSQQVQRGLGASKVAVPSVGGTINVLTKSTDAKKGGTFSYGMGNDGMRKQSLMVSTGLMDNGWAVTFLGSHAEADGWAKSTDFEGWTYFLAIGKQINDNHRLSLTAFGAPQWHNQRRVSATIETYQNHKDGRRMNLGYGYRNGERYNVAYNYYHKPQVSLNHYWTINEKTSLSTALYASMSTGGGRSNFGANKNWLRYDDGGVITPSSETRVTDDGYIDFDGIIADNAASATGSSAVITNEVNSHQWYGILSTLSTELTDNIDLTGGVDVRYYIGEHRSEIDDLLGGAYIVDNSNINRDPNQQLHEGDAVYYNNDGEVLWGGLFAQAEYKKDALSAFISASVSGTQYRRIDYFQYTPGNQKTDWQNFLGYSVKGGANYNLDQHHNVFVNLGYFEKAPFFNSVFLNYENTINPDAANERVYSAEVGYGYRSKKLSVNLNGYYTMWMDKALATTEDIRDEETGVKEEWRFNVLGLDALHMGLELDFKYRPFEELTIKGMASIGDWTWNSNGIGNGVNMDDRTDTSVQTITVYAKDLKVGDAAQTTAALGVDYQVFDNIKIGANYNYYANLYAYFQVTDRQTAGVTTQPWKMPEYGLVDLNVRYDFMVGGLDATLYGNVYNVFNTEYLSDATDGTAHDARTSYGYYGFGRTASIRLKIRF